MSDLRDDLAGETGPERRPEPPPRPDASDGWGPDLRLSEHTDTGSSEALADHIAQARDAERKIGAFTGDVAPDLSREAEFRTGEDFARRMPGVPDDASGTYGFVRVDDGSVVVRDAPVAAQDGTLLHEGLHRWQLEAAGEPLAPAALNEAVTEHFARSIEPQPEVLYDELPDGRAHLLVPDLAPGQEIDDDVVVIEPAPEIYADARAFASELEAAVGRDALLDLCRTNDHDGFADLVDEATGPGTWDQILGHLEGGAYDADWRSAREALRARRG